MLDKILRQIHEHAKTFNYTFSEHDKEELIALYEMNNDHYDESTFSLHIEDYVQRKPQSENSDWMYQRRPSVSARRVTPVDDSLCTFDKNEDTAHFLLKALGSDIPFSLITEEQKKKLVKSMYPLIVEEGTVLIQQGDVGAEMYVVQDGEFDVLIDGQVSNKLRPGSRFGELALLHEIPRTATVRATTRSLVWAAEQTSFSLIRICDQLYRKSVVRNALQSNHSFSSQKEVNKIVDSAVFKIFFPRNVVELREGEFLIVLKDAKTVYTESPEVVPVSKESILTKNFTAASDLECAIISTNKRPNKD